MSPAVSVHGCSKRFRTLFGGQEVMALRQVHLSVAPGEIFGLLGPNGAGKTTLVKILLGIVHPSEGEAALFGVSTRHPAARRRVGYLPENHRFPGFLTAEQMLHLYGQMAGVSPADRHLRIPDLLEQVRMSRWRTARIRTFSKGMMQRLGLAQALLNDPDLLFLDEPTDGVDPLGRREIRDLLLHLRDQGKTVFLNSHLLSEVEQVCSRVAILNQGRCVREGTVEELTEVDRVYELLCTPLPPEALSVLAGAVALQESNAPLETYLLLYTVRAADRRALNAILDQLRSHDVLIEAVRPVRRTLEDYFVEAVQEDDAALSPAPPAPSSPS